MIWFKNNYPRIWVLFIDLMFCLFSIVLAFSLRFNFSIPPRWLTILPFIILFVLLIRGLSFWLNKTHKSIIRYTNTRDVAHIFLVLSGGSILFVFSNIFRFYLIDGVFIIPLSIIIIDFFTSVFLLTTYRLMIKSLYMDYAYSGKSTVNVAIYGAGEAGIITKEALDRDSEITYRVMAFVDDSPMKAGKKVEGIKIIRGDQLEKLLSTTDISILIVAVQNICVDRKKRIIETALKHNTRVLNVPPVSQWINGQLSFKQIKTVNIEDLLEREVISIKRDELVKELTNRVILITGAAGSIGSELAKQIIEFDFKKLILVDQAETSLFHMEAEFSKYYRFSRTEFLIGDVCNKHRMEKIFNTYKPDLFFMLLLINMFR